MGAETLCIRLRWPDGIRCPRCSGEQVAARPRRTLSRWRCRACRRDFTVTTESALHSSKIGLDAWARAAATEDSSPSGVKRLLGVSAPTARRVARALELTERPPGPKRLEALLQMPADVESVVTRRLPWYLDPDDNPIESLTAGQRTVMAVLRNCYRGATAARIAAEARLSPAHARRCLNELARRGYAVCEESTVQRGYQPTRARVWSLSPSESCAEAVAYLPRRPVVPGECPERVPPEFWWLFWSGANAADLRLPEHALAVAATMLSGPDVAARNWALTHLPVDALKQIRTMRGYDAGSIAIALDSTIRAREAP